MYHRPSKKAQVAKLAIIYTIMTSAVVLVVSVMVFYALGYRFNQTDGAIEQGALLQFSSKPRGAKVQLDGFAVGGRTPNRNTVVAGNHQVSYELDGYREWRKSFAANPGNVIWLDYARMIPNEIKTTSVARYSKLNDMVASPNSNYIALQESSSEPTIQILDVRKDNVETSTIHIPAKAYTTPTKKAKQSFKIDSWSPDSNYLLIKHTYGKKHEWILVKRSDAKSSQNLSTLFGIDAKSMVMASSDAIYADVDDSVRLLSISKETLSRPLINNVQSYDYQSGTLIFSTKPDKKTQTKTVGYYNTSSDKTVTIKTFKDKSVKHVDIAVGTYYHEQYLAIAIDNRVDIYEGNLPTSNNASLKQLGTMSFDSGTASWLRLSPGSQYVYAQQGDQFITYDLATKTDYSAQLKGDAKITKRISWLDKHSLWSDRDGTLRFYDFDGANQQDIVSVASGYDAVVSPNNKFVYSINKSKSKNMILQRSQLIIDN